MTNLRKIPITQEFLKNILHYNPRTGVFTWLYDANPNQGILKGSQAGTLNKQGYWVISFKKKLYRAHNLAWYYMYGEWIKIDHKDLNRLNNKLSNLRPASTSQNNANRSGDKTRKLKKGVYLMTNGKFRSAIKKDGKQQHIGCFNTEKEAHKAYCAKGKQLFGYFFRSN